MLSDTAEKATRLEGLMDGGALASPIGATATAVDPTTPKGKVTVRVTFKPKKAKTKRVTIMSLVKKWQKTMMSMKMMRMTTVKVAPMLLAGAVLAIGFGPATTAQAEEFGIASFVAEPRANTYAPDPLVAGAHPDLYTRVEFTSEELPNPSYNPTFCTLFPSPQYCDQTVRGALATPSSLAIDLPRGVVLNPQVVPACSRADYAASVTNCADARVGQGTIVLGDGSVRPLDLYSVAPSDQEPASIGIVASGAKVGFLTARVTPEGGYAIRTRTDHIARIFGPIVELELRMWGVPAASNPGASADAPHRALVTNPTSCGEPAVTSLRVSTYEDPHRTHEATAGTPPATGCDSLPWDGSIEMRTIGRAAGGPAGLDVDLLFPFTTNPMERANANLKRVLVRLPEGVSINPGVARDLTACSDTAFGKENGRDAACPPNSKIGTIRIETPLLSDALPGDVYVGQPKPGNLYRLFLYAEGPGVRVKLEGEVRPDPVTGQLTAIFEDNPQLPFTRFNLRIRGGARSALAMPRTCGSKVALTSFEPWSGQPDLTLSSTFQIYGTEDGEPCPEKTPFNLDFAAGTTVPTAGGTSAFSLAIARGDADQELKSIKSVRLPEGLLGKVASVPLCGEAQANAGTCPEASRVGRIQAALGVGSSPLWVPLAGNEPTAVYLAGPYKGAPYSLSIVVPAQAGPFDLGRVVVRSALRVDERTAAITTGVDETRLIDTDGRVTEVLPEVLPRILEGIVLKQREIRVIVDREGFMVNPTDCSVKEITAEVSSVDDDRVNVGNRFRAVDCAALGFKPRFGARILDKGRRSTLRSFHPRTQFTVVPRKGDANIGGARVVLPSSVILDQGNIGTTCTRAKMAARDCPAASIVGYAKAWSPLLRKAVEGPVYLAANGGARPLPDLAAVLDGEVRVVLQGEVSTQRSGGKARLQNLFRVVPDAPVSRFVLTMRGGKKRGLLVNSTDLCRSKERGVGAFIGQNNRRSRTAFRLTPSFKGCVKVRRQAARKAAARKAAARKAARRKATQR